MSGRDVWRNNNPPLQTSSSYGEHALQKVRELIDTVLWIGVVDGRVFQGRFLCVDRCQNIILNETMEYYEGDLIATRVTNVD